eukprot:12855111-Alexandrium_andersonii.AAC.1
MAFQASLHWSEVQPGGFRTTRDEPLECMPMYMLQANASTIANAVLEKSMPALSWARVQAMAANLEFCVLAFARDLCAANSRFLAWLSSL